MMPNKILVRMTFYTQDGCPVLMLKGFQLYMRIIK